MKEINETKENCRTLLKILTGKETILFTNRCNESLKLSLKIAKALGRSTCLFQEEGGWMYYEKFILENELDPIRLVTNDGLIFEKELKYYSHDSVLLINSYAGYVALHDMSSIFSKCIENDIFLINDVSGSIGTKEAKFGEIIVGSFGEGKPVNMGKGGFIAVDDNDWIKYLDGFKEVDLDFKLLEEKLKNIETRRQYLINITKRVKKDLADFNIVHKNHDGLNVIVRFSNEKEREELIKYCKKHNYEYTLCPREIRILDDAVSIEIKRL